MKRNRMLALLLAGCMVLGNSNVLLHAEEEDDQFFMIEEDEGSEIQEDVMEVQVDEEDDLYAGDLIEDEEEVLVAAETADTNPPTIDIESLTVTYPEGKTAATVGDEVRISVKVTDEESGVGSVSISYRFPQTGRDHSYDMTETGTAGVYEAVIPISEDNPSGEYQITNIIARDKKDNSVYFYNENLYPIVPNADLSAGNFTVEGTTPDVTTPSIDIESLTVTYPEGKTSATVGDEVRISVKVADEESGVKSVQISYRFPQTGRDHSYDMTETGTAGVYEAVIPISEDNPSGEYQITNIIARDKKDNSVYFYNENLYPIVPYADLSSGNFTVEGTSPDVTAPSIDIESLTVTYLEGKTTATVGDEVRISVKVVDEESGVKSVQISYRFPQTGRDHSYDMTETGTAGVYEAVIPISEDNPSGEYQITNIIARDKKDNSVYFYNENLYPIVPYADLSSGNFTVTEMFKITFDSRGGSEVETQYVLPGYKATEPERPVKGEGAWTVGGGEFAGWYTDEALQDSFFFNTPINENITLYAKWYYGFSVCSYDISNQECSVGGQFSVTHPLIMGNYSYGGNNYTVSEDNITLSAKPDQGYIFKGWYKGETADAYNQTSRPLDVNDPENLLSNDKEYTFYLDSHTIICPVFEVCTDHDFGPDQTIKATITAEGRVYHVCKNCGTVVTIKVLPKLKPATPTEKITIFKKPSIKKPDAKKNKITVKWKHFKHTSKKAKKIWKKIKKVQVQCATDKACKNIIKDVKIGRGKTKYAIKGLKKKTTYYVRVRYFDGVGYSAWSKVKKVKTK